MTKKEIKKLQIKHKATMDKKFPTKWIYFDVDDTLVMWEGNVKRPGKNKVKVSLGDENFYLTPNVKNIELMRKYRSLDEVIIVWSLGGFAWARSVLRALNLHLTPDYVLTKPTYYVDDRPNTYILKKSNNLYKK